MLVQVTNYQFEVEPKILVLTSLNLEDATKQAKAILRMHPACEIYVNIPVGDVISNWFFFYSQDRNPTTLHRLPELVYNRQQAL